MMLSALWGGISAYAQSQAIFGKVVDAEGQALIGAAVLVPGTSNGTTTDLDGNFNIRVAPGTDWAKGDLPYFKK